MCLDSNLVCAAGKFKDTNLLLANEGNKWLNFPFICEYVEIRLGLLMAVFFKRVLLSLWFIIWKRTKLNHFVAYLL